MIIQYYGLINKYFLYILSSYVRAYQVGITVIKYIIFKNSF